MSFQIPCLFKIIVTSPRGYWVNENAFQNKRETYATIKYDIYIIVHSVKSINGCGSNGAYQPDLVAITETTILVHYRFIQIIWNSFEGQLICPI